MKRMGLIVLLSAITSLAVMGCRGRATTTPYKTLTTKQWQLECVESSDGTFTLKPEQPVTLVMSDSSTFSGHGGCNSYFGVFSTNKTEIEIDIELQGRSMAMCEEIDFEDRYLEILDGCTTYSAVDDKMQLNNNELGMVLKFNEIKQTK